MHVLNKGGLFHVLRVLREFSPSYRRNFQSVKVLNALNKFLTLFQFSRPVEISTRPILAKPTIEKFEKTDFFKIA